MNRQELAWKHFMETGSVSAYLAYRRTTTCTKTEGDLQHADFNRWNHPESEKSGK